MSKKPDLRLATELLGDAVIDLRPRKPRIHKALRAEPTPVAAPAQPTRSNQAVSATPTAEQVLPLASQPSIAAALPRPQLRPLFSQQPRTASATGEYQRLRLPAVSRTIVNGFTLFASCVDGGSPETRHRPPPPQGHPMPYAADSIRVQRISPAPSGPLSLSLATRAKMLSLQGTGSQECVQVVCPAGEVWRITVGDSLGLISPQDDIAGGLRMYNKPAIVRQLEFLDRIENELRRFMPPQCFLLSLLSCVRREISWLLPSAADPASIAREYFGRFCRMLLREPVARDLLSWFRNEIKPAEGASLLQGMQPLLQQMPHRPSHETLLALFHALANRHSAQAPYKDCLDSLVAEHPHVADFSLSINILKEICYTAQTIVAQWTLSPEQKQGIVAALCRATGQAPFSNATVLDVLAHPIQIDHRRFSTFPQLECAWEYSNGYMHGKEAEMNERYQAFLEKVRNRPR